MKNLYAEIPRLLASEPVLALATVVRTSGSTPQKPGSMAVISPSGVIAGTVGGGIVEGRATLAAIDAMSSHNALMHKYELTSDISAKEEAICGGVITVLIDPNPGNHLNVFTEIRTSLGKRIPGVLVTMVTPFSKDAVMVNRYWMTMQSKPELPPDFIAALGPAVNELLSSAGGQGFREMELQPGVEEPASLFFLEPVFPPERLVIAGAGHIGKSLAHLGSRLGFDVTVIDDRPEFASSQNIPEADTLITGDIGAAMEKIEKDEDTYAVIVTRGHRDDAAALRPCIGTSLAYTGMIGSRKKIASMRAEFLQNGWATEDQWNRIYAPIGIEIGSQTVEEIAVSIAAQLIKVRSGH